MHRLCSATVLGRRFYVHGFAWNSDSALTITITSTLNLLYLFLSEYWRTTVSHGSQIDRCVENFEERTYCSRQTFYFCFIKMFNGLDT